MKKLLFIVLSTLPILLGSCKKTEYLDNQPQLEIKVLDANGEAISNASVVLYNSENDWKAQTNPVTSHQTDNLGIVLFDNLQEQVYYFYASKGELNNKESVSILNDPLKVNVRAQITTILK